MSEPRDEPTRRIPAARPREPVAPAASSPPPARTWEEELADRIATLRNWLVLASIVAVAGLGVAVYALTQASDDSSSSGGTTSSSVSDLADRVAALEQNEPSSKALADLKSDLSSIDDRVSALEDSGSGTGSGDGVTQADLDQLTQQIDTLNQRVDALSNGSQ